MKEVGRLVTSRKCHDNLDRNIIHNMNALGLSDQKLPQDCYWELKLFQSARTSQNGKLFSLINHVSNYDRTARVLLITGPGDFCGRILI